MRNFYFKSRLWFVLCLLFTILLLCFVENIAPAQTPVIAYKLGIVLLGGIAGYSLDRALFRYAEPSSYLCYDWRKSPDADRPNHADYPIVDNYFVAFFIAQVRQVLLVVTGMLAVGLGL